VLFPTPVKFGLATLCAMLAGVVDVVVLTVLVELGAPIALAAAISTALAAATAFLGNKYVAFRDRAPLSVQQVATFVAIAAGTTLLTAAAMQLVAVHLGVPYLIAKGIVGTATFVGWSYPAQRRFVFRVSSVPA